MEGLISMIYHEKQQEGSMLCAQHALNSLLQGNYFTAPDLSSIALHLDALEETYDDDNTGTTSTNMDDTGILAPPILICSLVFTLIPGFFSVQVLDNALKVWGLNLVRWRSEEMRPYHDHPHTQLAFILNLEQHWFTLRRFGHALPNMDHDQGIGHWFNLNSFLPSPEWVGKLYLGMVLQQAEAEGYSVFTVVQAEPTAPLALPRTDSDEIASTLPEPTSASRPSRRTSFARNADRRSSPNSRPTDLEDIEDDDYELQAALQASLMTLEADHAPFNPPPLARAPIPLPEPRSSSSSVSPPDSGSHTPQVVSMVPEHENVDPVAASMERNRILLQRMREEQEYAQRELWAEADLSSEEAAGVGERRQRRLRQEEEEQVELRTAIQESQEFARRNRATRDDNDAKDDEDYTMDDGEVHAPARNPYPTSDIFDGNRVYDDDDAELQAALKASLESVPPGWQHVEPNLPRSRPASLPSTDQTPTTNGDGKYDQSMSSDGTTDQHSSVAETAEPLSVDEIRRKRLAKFGA